MNEAELNVFKSLKNVKVVFDVGAREDIEYLKLKPKAEYHLFEPNPEFFDKLKAKVGDRKNVHLNNFGLGDEEVIIPYSVNQQAFEGGECNLEGGTSFILPIKTLNSYIEDNNITRIDFLKIDTEGYDFKVLQGGSKAVEMARYIQYEYWDKPQQFHILEDRFDMEYIGYRNVICRRRK